MGKSLGDQSVTIHNPLALPPKKNHTKNVHLSTYEVKLPPKPLKYYVRNYWHNHEPVTYVALERDTKCPGCRTSLLDVGKDVVAPPPGGGDEAIKNGLSKEGYVKDVTYRILDDLDVIPLTSFISALYHVLQNCNDQVDLEIKVVHVGMDEGLKMMKAALHSTTVLTDVFLGKKPMRYP